MKCLVSPQAGRLLTTRSVPSLCPRRIGGVQVDARPASVDDGHALMRRLAAGDATAASELGGDHEGPSNRVEWGLGIVDGQVLVLRGAAGEVDFDQLPGSLPSPTPTRPSWPASRWEDQSNVESRPLQHLGSRVSGTRLDAGRAALEMSDAESDRRFNL